MDSNIAQLTMHDKCEHKKRLNFYTQYKISSAFCDSNINVDVGGLSMRLRGRRSQKLLLV